MIKNQTVQLPAQETGLPQVELRTGAPYANLITHHLQFASAIAEYFGVEPGQVIPAAGATGAIEAVRNHVFRSALKPAPGLLTVSPGYWRARECFQGFGFKVFTVETRAGNFRIDEAELINKTAEIRPDAIYLSLPNNPTGAVFDPEKIVRGAPEGTAILLDLTLPSRALDTRTLTQKLFRNFLGRKKLFLIGSTSKSHNTAEYRIGWAICANPEDALQLKQENRNVVSSVSVDYALRQMEVHSPVTEMISESFARLRAAEAGGGFELIEPPRHVETGYVLIRPAQEISMLRQSLEHRGISVLWGSECGLTDEYIRLETSAPANIEIFINALKSLLRKKQSA
ncbi:MAG TPA: pyridoxal phosphate-dependent aminotransferase [Candidatus Angelobacter sp.]|jgi:histidinol-phosphate/aromatic aminotransferase/cobyric acid decarboxylase-like protein